ncbi:MAG: hypothetical protein HY925_16720 [Elusimicrobia bacterium]|nr:hypothetical protein [Elusimicrobiota bacterium]
MRIFVLTVSLSLSVSGLRAAAETPPQAAVEASPEKGLRLSEPALKTLELKTEPVGAPRDVLQLPAGALVYSQDRVGVYRL